MLPLTVFLSNEVTQSLKLINTSSLDLCRFRSTPTGLFLFFNPAAGTSGTVCKPAMSGSSKGVYLQLGTQEFFTREMFHGTLCQTLGSVASALKYSFHRDCMMLCENRVVLRDKNVCENMICCPFLFLNCFWLEVKASRLTVKPSQRKHA